MSLKTLIQEQLATAYTNDEKRKVIRKLRKTPDIFSQVVDATSFLTFNPVEFTTRLYYILNDKTEVEKCFCCGKPLLRNCNLEGKTLRYCSRKCSAVHGVTKGQKTKLERYGSSGYMNPDKARETWKSKTQIELDEINRKHRETSRSKYGVDHPNQSIEIKKKTIETNLKKYGETNPSKSQVIKDKIHTVTLQRYGVDNVMHDSKVKEKFQATLDARTPEEQKQINEIRKQTCLSRYGVEHASENEDVRHRISQSHQNHTPEQVQASNMLRTETCLSRYGVTHVTQLPQVREKSRETCLSRYGIPFPPTDKFRRVTYQYNNITFDSSYELYYYIWAVENGHNIEKSVNKYLFEVDGKEHYYFPDFTVDGVDIELKGEHFFDEEGNLINPFTNDLNIQSIFSAKGECMKSNDISIITNIDEQKHYVDSKYTTNFVPLFRTDLKFPYLNQDLKNKSDMGLIQHFHKSIYDANRKGYLSPKEAWKDKSLILKSALNRLKYVNTCRPSDVLQGFNVAKIAPKVSVFNPRLAMNLINKYITTENIVDPFSGFSGRMLGAYRCGRTYTGFDLNEDHVKESNDIITYLNASSSLSVSVQDLFNSEETCLIDSTLFTCPPYKDLENWNKEKDTNLSCDDWIDECILRYKCSSYLFIVNETMKYKNKIVEYIENKSHFGSNTEYVVLIRN